MKTKLILHQTKHGQGFTLIELLVVITIIGILAGFAGPALSAAIEKGHMAGATNNAKQIAMILRAYAGDHHGLYPDANREAPPQTANDAFRLLMKNGLTKDERVFGCPVSRFIPDGVVGKAPDFADALEAGENHWCMSKGISDGSDGNVPLVFENPTSDTWPPTWNCDIAGLPREGRAWRGGRIIIVRNDGSATSEALDASTGSQIGLKKDKNGDDLFSQMGEDLSFLNNLRE